MPSFVTIYSSGISPKRGINQLIIDENWKRDAKTTTQFKARTHCFINSDPIVRRCNILQMTKKF